jgi:hypothetical protein
MAKPLPTSGSHRNGLRADAFGWSAHANPSPANGHALDPAAPSTDLEFWDLENTSQAGPGDASAALDPLAGAARPEGGTGDGAADLRAENERLRGAVAELEEILRQADGPGGAQVKQLEQLLEEKSEVIRELHRKLQEQQHQERTAGATPREEELLALSEELERERRQLKEDEEGLMQQMRDMEVQMSRERAEVARQRNELQRLQNEIRHELELAARDATLRERLAPLQRRAQDLLARRGTAAPPEAAAPQAQPAPAREPAPKRDPGSSGILRRLFG